MDKDDNPLLDQEPYNAVDAISMRHDICYRDKQSKQLCDDQMLRELNELDPKDLRERIDKSLVNTIIGAKRKLGWGIPELDLKDGKLNRITWTNLLADELHKPIRKHFPRRIVFAKKENDI